MDEERFFIIELSQGEKSIEVMFPERATDTEKQQCIDDAIAKMEQNGQNIVGAEPIIEIYTEIIGRRFVVEDEDAWEKRRQKRMKEASGCV